jgi:hypothetical protein
VRSTRVESSVRSTRVERFSPDLATRGLTSVRGSCPGTAARSG